MFKIAEYLFIKRKHLDINEYNTKAKYGIISSIFGLICNILLCVFKVIVGLIFQSIAIITDGVNNITDSFASIISLIGFKISKKEADEHHPYGHERIEYISALMVAVLIISLAIILGKNSLLKIINKETMDLSKFYLILILLISSILIKTWMALIYSYSFKKTKFMTLKADISDSINDIIATSFILISLIVAKIFDLNLDGYLGLALALYMLFSGIKLMVETISPLIGEAPDKKEVDKYLNNILAYDKILGAHDLILHHYGANKIYATVDVEMNRCLDIMDCHNIIDKIERDFKNNYNILLKIHLDPIDLEDEDIIKYRSVLENILKDSNHSFHDFRLIKSDDNIKILFDLIIPFQENKDKNKIVDEIKEKLLKKYKEIKDINYEFIIDVDNI